MCNERKKTEDGKMKLMFKGDRFSKETISISSFKFLFDSDLTSVKDYLSKYFPIDNNHLRVNENLIRTSNDDAPIHVNFCVSNP